MLTNSVLLPRYLLAIACAFALLTWVCRRTWRHLPFYGLYLAVQLPLLLICLPEDLVWLRTDWLWYQPIIIVFRVLAVWEAYWVHTHGQADLMPRLLLGSLLTLVSVCMVFFGWSFLSSEPIINLVQLRRSVVIFCWSFLALYLAIVVPSSLPVQSWRNWHVQLYFSQLSILMLIVLCSLGLPGTAAWSSHDWYLADIVSNYLTALLLLLWSVLVPRSCQRATQGPESGHHVHPV